MKSRFLIAMCAMLMSPFAMAFQDELVAQDPSIAAYDKVIAGHQVKVVAFRAKLTEAKSSAERRKLYDTESPKADNIVPDLKKIMTDHPKSDGAFASAKWIASNTRGAHVQMAVGVLAKDFATKAGVGEVCLRMTRDRKIETFKFIQQVMIQNTNRTDQGQACFALAKWYSGSAATLNRLMTTTDEKRLERMRKSTGEETIAFLKSQGNETLMKEALTHFKRVQQEFADVPYRRNSTLGASSEGAVFEISNLQIGKKSPDITAEDIDGVKFSLSDYLGKVVVLDFWGDW
ncbi:MAG: hypothetical protein ACI97A_001196 [Planctomycetota bacterium]|jgi:hypothetical protein